MRSIDNAGAEASLIREYSSKGDTSNLVAVPHLVMAVLDTRTYWSNWTATQIPKTGFPVMDCR